METNRNKNWFERLNEELEPFFGGNFPTGDEVCEFKGTGLPEEHFRFEDDLFNAPVSPRTFNGFVDTGDGYELVTKLGGNEHIDESQVKIKLHGDNTVGISYEHKKESERNGKSFCSYSYSQHSSVILPADADKDTLKAYFDDDNNVVVHVQKIGPKPAKSSRVIPISR